MISSAFIQPARVRVGGCRDFSCVRGGFEISNMSKENPGFCKLDHFGQNLPFLGENRQLFEQNSG